MLEIKNIKKVFKSQKGTIEVLKGVSFSIEQGEVIGLIGENGAGKTTLIKSICNLADPSAGDVLYNGKSILKNPSLVGREIGVLLEGARNLYNFLSIDKNLKYFGYLNKLSDSEIEKREDELLSEFNIKKYKDRPVNELSRGTQQKVAIMVTLMKNPSILILDEPTLGLDLISKINVQRTIAKLANINKTLIIISHDMNLISNICNRIIYISHGSLVFDKKIKSLKNDRTTFEIVIRKKEKYKSIFSNKILKEEEDVLKIETNNLQNSLEVIDNEDIISIEKKEFDLEEFLKGYINYENN